MPAPNAQLEAALNQFGNEPGVTPQQVNQLRAAIVASPALVRALNQDAANGHLQGFALAPPGPESIGDYDLASKKITIPAEVLSGSPPVNPDLRAVLKLQDMSLRFAHTPGVTADMHDNLEKSINGSPVLIDQFKDAVRDESQRHLRSFNLHTTVGAGGSYDPKERSMKLTPASLTPGTFDQHNMTFVLGHEMEHGFNRERLERSRDTYITSLRTIAGDNNPVNDYTSAMQTRLQAHRVDEAESHIAGWNAMLSYEKQRSGNQNVTLLDMWNNTAKSRVADFIELDATGNVKLDANGNAIGKSGLVFNADNTITPSAGPNGNVAKMGQYYFDQSPAGTLGKLPIDTMSVGPYNHSDYPNYYGVGVVGLAIWAEQEISVPKHGNASQMRLNMQQLKFNEVLLEENGLSIGSGGTAFQTYRDTSTTPPTVGRFDHTYDGPNKNQHVPVDMPGYTSGIRMSGPGGASGRDDALEQTVAPVKAQATQAPLLSDPAHLGQAMYLQTLKAFDESPNIPAGTFTQHQKETLAAGIVTQAMTQQGAFPKAQVDHVVFNNDRTMVIGVQGALDSPTNFLAGANVQQTLATSIERSSEVSQVALQSMQQKQEKIRIQSEMLGVDALTATGPVMRMGGRTMSAQSDGGGQGGDGGGGG
jgi:hypothetical protein